MCLPVPAHEALRPCPGWQQLLRVGAWPGRLPRLTQKVEKQQKGRPEPSATAEIMVISGEGGLMLGPSVPDSAVLTKRGMASWLPALKLKKQVVAS